MDNSEKSLLIQYKLTVSHDKVRKDLSLIVPILNKIITNYDSFEWTVDKITEYRQKEKEAILENNKAIELAISNSFELNFSRGR